MYKKILLPFVCLPWRPFVALAKSKCRIVLSGRLDVWVGRTISELPKSYKDVCSILVFQKSSTKYVLIT